MKRILSIVAAVVVLVGLMLTASVPIAANGGNLIVNGDFESGNTGFYTEYIYTTNLWPAGTYMIGTSPALYHPNFWDFGDHTSGYGKMMILNDFANGVPYEVVWAQNVTNLTYVNTYPVTTYGLIADNWLWEAGEVQVKTSEEGFCVRIVLTDQRGDPDEGWLISKMHVAIAANPEDIPGVDKQGNPNPGQFPINLTFTPGVLDTDWQCLPYDWVEGTAVYIAAAAMLTHAEVLDPYQPYDSETGWGEGSDFPGKNWAMCISYTPEVVRDYGSYLLEFWASSAVPQAPAQLQVKINGNVLGAILNCPTTPGTWLPYSESWNAGPVDHAYIEIRDLRNAYSGDDFVIDDILFVKQ